MKHTTQTASKQASDLTDLSKKGSVAHPSDAAQKKSDKPLSKNEADVAGWIQDASLETSLMSYGYQPQPGEREVEFSVAVRRRQDVGQEFAELRGRALIHAAGNVLALAEASFVAPINKDEAEAERVQRMYPPLREALQSLLGLAGHVPPLPESIEMAT